MIEACARPGGAEMTGLAGVAGTNVARRLALGDKSVMAGAALAGRPLEHSVAVTVFAVDEAVRAVERKTRLQVIRYRLRTRRRTGGRERLADEGETAEENADDERACPAQPHAARWPVLRFAFRLVHR